MKQMKRLTVKEEEIMRIFWEHGPMFVRELLYHSMMNQNRIITQFLPLFEGWRRKVLWGIKPTEILINIMLLFRKRSIRVRHSKKWFPSIIIIPISM